MKDKELVVNFLIKKCDELLSNLKFIEELIEKEKNIGTVEVKLTFYGEKGEKIL